MSTLTPTEILDAQIANDRRNIDDCRGNLQLLMRCAPDVIRRWTNTAYFSNHLPYEAERNLRLLSEYFHELGYS